MTVEKIFYKDFFFREITFIAFLEEHRKMCLQISFLFVPKAYSKIVQLDLLGVAVVFFSFISYRQICFFLYIFIDQLASMLIGFFSLVWAFFSSLVPSGPRWAARRSKRLNQTMQDKPSESPRCNDMVADSHFPRFFDKAIQCEIARRFPRSVVKVGLNFNSKISVFWVGFNLEPRRI